MTQLESPAEIEGIVGARRHPILHLGRAVSAEQRVYILHSEACSTSGIDLRACTYSRALDEGIDLGRWEQFQDVPVVLAIDEEYDDLVPSRTATQDHEIQRKRS